MIFEIFSSKKWRLRVRSKRYVYIYIYRRRESFVPRIISAGERMLGNRIEECRVKAIPISEYASISRLSSARNEDETGTGKRDSCRVIDLPRIASWMALRGGIAAEQSTATASNYDVPLRPRLFFHFFRARSPRGGWWEQNELDKDILEQNAALLGLSIFDNMNINK